MGKKIRFLYGIVFLLAWAATLSGQGVTARITGNVSDEEGVPLSGVTVLAINVNSNAEMAAQTEKQGGKFRLLGLPPGTYQVSFELPGYITFVAAGVRLQAEQSINLRITLKRDKAAQAATQFSALPEALGGEGSTDQGPIGFRRRFSLAFSVGLNYLAVGDCNEFLADHSRRYMYSSRNFETFNSGIDLNAEFGYRISPRLEITAGLGLIQDSLLDNSAFGTTWAGTREWSRIGFSLKTIPVQLMLRYWLGTSGVFTYSVQGGVFFNFATWKMRTGSLVNQWASARGLGFTVGGRGELTMDEHVNFIIDISGRLAPVRNFSGWWQLRETYNTNGREGRGWLWYFEYYDDGLKRWMWDLGVRGRPIGPGVRNVSRAEVDFSGLALRFGFLIHF